MVAAPRTSQTLVDPAEAAPVGGKDEGFGEGGTRSNRAHGIATTGKWEQDGHDCWSHTESCQWLMIGSNCIFKVPIFPVHTTSI